MPTSSSSQAPLEATRDYVAESKVKVPRTKYLEEEDYNDQDHVLYKADCDQYKVAKLQVLMKQEDWKDQEKVADMAHVATAAHEKAEAERCQWEAEEQAHALSSTQPARKHHQAASPGLPEGEDDPSTFPVPGEVCQCFT